MQGSASSPVIGWAVSPHYYLLGSRWPGSPPWLPFLPDHTRACLTSSLPSDQLGALTLASVARPAFSTNISYVIARGEELNWFSLNQGHE